MDKALVRTANEIEGKLEPRLHGVGLARKDDGAPPQSDGHSPFTQRSPFGQSTTAQ